MLVQSWMSAFYQLKWKPSSFLICCILNENTTDLFVVFSMWNTTNISVVLFRSVSILNSRESYFHYCHFTLWSVETGMPILMIIDIPTPVATVMQFIKMLNFNHYTWHYIGSFIWGSGIILIFFLGIISGNPWPMLHWWRHPYIDVFAFFQHNNNSKTISSQVICRFSFGFIMILSTSAIWDLSGVSSAVSQSIYSSNDH